MSKNILNWPINEVLIINEKTKEEIRIVKNEITTNSDDFKIYFNIDPEVKFSEEVEIVE